jgi:hypothetical protein
MSREARTLSTAGAAANAGTYADMLARTSGCIATADAARGPCRRRQAVRDRAARIVCTPQDVRVADSGDLAVSHGKYREIARSGSRPKGSTRTCGCATPAGAGASPTTSAFPRRDELAPREGERTSGLRPATMSASALPEPQAIVQQSVP